MIHISVPTYCKLNEKCEPYKNFYAYDIHVNGVYHASVRYSALYNLHEKLVEVFGFRLDVPEFPPKKIWRTLDNKAVSERRDSLTKYLQGVIQNQDIGKHIVLEKAFLDFQVNSFDCVPYSVKLDVYLPDGRPVVVDCFSDDSTNFVMKKFCEIAEINLKHSGAFGLFLGRDIEHDVNKKESTSNVLFEKICVHWLKNFESPFISWSLANKNGSTQFKILVRRITWNPSAEEPLLDDAGCLKLFYLQAVSDFQRGVMRFTQDVCDKLEQFQAQNNIRQFLRLCHEQPSYGYELLAPVVSDFPSNNTYCQLKVGRRQLVLEYDDNGITMQTILRSTRIRVWRVSHNNSQSLSTATSPVEMTFQIEYLVGKDEFGMITLNTFQAFILSLFLQSIAAEILHDQPNSNSPTFKFNDSISTKAIECLEVSKLNSIVSDDLSIKGYQSNSVISNGAIETLLKIISYQMPFDHDSFEEITDDDL